MKKFIGKKTNKIVSVKNTEDFLLDEPTNLTEVFYTDLNQSNENILLELKIKYEDDFEILSNGQECLMNYNLLMGDIEDKIKIEVDRIIFLIKDKKILSFEKILLNNKIVCQNNPWNVAYEYYITGFFPKKFKLYIEDDYDNGKETIISNMDTAVLIVLLCELEKIKNIEDIIIE